MVMTDPIADFLTRIRNANQAKHEVLEVPASNIKKGIAEILKREGFVKNVEVIEDDKQGIIRVFLKYGQNGEKDYYISFAFHYYSLIYCRFMRENDPDRCALYEERAKLFAADFINWFAEDGSALATAVL